MDNYKNPIPGKSYISPRLKSFGNNPKKVRIISKVLESDDSYAFAKIKDETVIRHKKDATTYITAKFFEDDRDIYVVNIQGYTVATEKPHNASFSFLGKEIDTVIEFFENIKSAKLDSGSAINITDEELKKLRVSDKQVRSLYQENKEVFEQVLKSEITKEDIIAIGFRKKQLQYFEKFLNDKEYFEKIKEKIECSNESLWQKFFEKNQWVFGYGLGYVFLSKLEGKKLEQVVQGYNVNNYGKRVDALMKTSGLISNLCFIEIKTHFTQLLESKPYRTGCWAPSKELAGAVAQVQGTVQAAIKTLSQQISFKDESGNPTGEEAFNYMPKSYLIIGNLDEFRTENGVNEDKYSSFELYRKNIINPEILTFDELFERAKFIIKNNES